MDPSSPLFTWLVLARFTVDSTGALYVGGITAQDATRLAYQSVWMSFPVTVGAFQTTPGAAFVMKLNPNASGLDYATYIDGPTGSNLSGVATDASGDAFVTGSTNSASFPTTPGAYQTTVSSDSLGTYATAYVMELNPSGSAPIYSTFFGASNGSASLSYGVAVDAGYLRL